jgi:hypothetical protein
MYIQILHWKHILLAKEETFGLGKKYIIRDTKPERQYCRDKILESAALALIDFQSPVTSLLMPPKRDLGFFLPDLVVAIGMWYKVAGKECSSYLIVMDELDVRS